MTVPDLIARLREVPGDLDLRDVVVQWTKGEKLRVVDVDSTYKRVILLVQE